MRTLAVLHDYRVSPKGRAQLATQGPRFLSQSLTQGFSALQLKPPAEDATSCPRAVCFGTLPAVPLATKGSQLKKVTSSIRKSAVRLSYFASCQM